jgi:hypothetical protein
MGILYLALTSYNAVLCALLAGWLNTFPLALYDSAYVTCISYIFDADSF